MTIIFTEKAEKEFFKLDKKIQKIIRNYIFEIAKLKDPKVRGKALVGELAGLWRYRVMDYRLICKIKEDELVILILSVKHRKEAYKWLKV